MIYLKKTRVLMAAIILLIGLSASQEIFAQASCSKDKKTTTSGCSPSACTSGQTKFQVAEVISNLRKQVYQLKLTMEKSTKVKFDPKAYTVHAFGKSTDNDKTLLNTISNHLKLMQADFSKKLNQKFAAFAPPNQPAKKVRYLNNLVTTLNKAYQNYIAAR